MLLRTKAENMKVAAVGNLLLSLCIGFHYYLRVWSPAMEGHPPQPVGAPRQRAAIARCGMERHARAWRRGTRGALLKAKRSDPASGLVARRSLPAREL